MCIGNVAGNQALYFNRTASPVKRFDLVSSHNFSKVYRNDNIYFRNIQTEPVPKDPFINPPEPPYQQPSFFNRPEVRVAGMFIGSGLAFGAVGAAIGAAAGNLGMGLAIGAGLGVIAPLAMIVYAISTFN